jgi:hypothetical protein
MGWMKSIATSWFVVLPKLQKRFVLWSFFVSSPQGKQIALKHEIKKSFITKSPRAGQSSVVPFGS